MGLQQLVDTRVPGPAAHGAMAQHAQPSHCAAGWPTCAALAHTDEHVLCAGLGLQRGMVRALCGQHDMMGRHAGKCAAK